MKLFIRYIVVPKLFGPEYFELNEIEDSYYLTENKHKFLNLRFIKAKYSQTISYKLILSSYRNIEIIRAGNNQNNYRQFIDQTQYQQVLFLLKVNIQEFEEVIKNNSINSNILIIKFEFQESFEDLLILSKILVQYNSYYTKVLVSNNYSYCPIKQNMMRQFNYLQDQFINNLEQTILISMNYDIYFKEHIPLNPAMVLYDLYE
ncbi:hypothetical protein ABPG74_012674 [Tetrahymena malaccensis]